LHPAVVYTLGRLVVFAGCAALLYLVGFRSWALVLVALLVSAVVSFFLLRGPRAAFAGWLTERAAARRQEQERLRELLRGRDEPPAA